MGTPRNLRMIIVVQLTRELMRNRFMENDHGILETMFLLLDQSHHNFLSQLTCKYTDIFH